MKVYLNLLFLFYVVSRLYIDLYNGYIILANYSLDWVHACRTYTSWWYSDMHACLLLMQACSAVLCEFELRVRVHSYLNDESRCATCTSSLGNPVYSCCDNLTNTGVCTGEELCDTFFRYCLRPLGDTRIQCLAFMAVDTELFSPNTDALSDIGDTLFGSENPFTFFGYDWTVSTYSVQQL